MAKQVKSISTFRLKWQATKQNIPANLLKDLDLNKGLGPSLDVLEETLFKALDLDDPEKMKPKVEKALADVYKKMTLYVAKIKAANESKPEQGRFWYALHHVLAKLPDQLYSDCKDLGVKRPNITFLEDNAFDRSPPPTEETDDGPKKTTRKVGFDMSKNEVFDRNKQGPHEPAPKDAMPTKGILKQPGEKSTKNLPDREIPSDKENLEDMHQVYDKFLKSLDRENPEKFLMLWARSAPRWLQYLDGKNAGQTITVAAGTLVDHHKALQRALNAKPFNEEEARSKFKLYSEGVDALVNLFPKDMSALRKETAKLKDDAKLMLSVTTSKNDK